jgi:16S rRNA (guanine966-N2)-methyltransferase
VRVTGGIARGRRLKSPSAGVRPTSDTVREAIFNVLESRDVDLARVLDLYAGSGALGIEALSRGAAWCDFVERSAANVALIRENLRLSDVDGRSQVHTMAVERAAGRLHGPYSLLLADPPYDDDAAIEAIARLAQPPLIGTATTLVLEHSRRRPAPETLGALRLAWSRRYGDTQVSLYRQQDAREEGPS